MNTPDDTSVSAPIPMEIPAPEAPDHDWLLQELVGIVNATGVGFGITLSVGGMLISGILVDGEKYLEGLAAGFEGVDSGGSTLGASLGSIPRRYKELYRRSDPDDPSVEPGEAINEPPVYIHIQDAQVYAPGGAAATPTGKGTWWRGRLSRVDGFWLGCLSVS